MDCSKLTFTAGRSSSVIEMTDVAVLPALTPWGRGVPKVSFIDSPSSSRSSWVAEKVKVFSVSPLLKVTLVGTPL